MKGLHLVAAALAGLTSGVAAYDGGAGSLADCGFAKADTNHDGRISWAEFRAYETGRRATGDADLRARFQLLDHTHQGALTHAEWQAWRHLQAAGSPPSAPSVSSGA